MNIKDAYIHNGEAILKDIQVSGSKLQKLKAGKDANDAYLTWVDVLDFSSFGASGHSHTWIGDGTLKMYAHTNNEINFGGTHTGTKIYFGYRATDSRSIPTEFVFGGSAGSAQLTASKFAAGLLALTSTETSATSTTKGINFTNGSSTAHIGLSTLLGIYSSGNIILRPDGATADATGNGSLKLTKDGATIYETFTAEKLVKSGGTSTQFLKADGSVDSNSYSLSTHDHDDKYLKLAGNTTSNPVTGPIYIDGSGLFIRSKDATKNVWEIVGDGTAWTSNYGFYLQYYGAGSGNNNDLVLYSHGQASTDIEVYRVHQDGSFIFKATPKVDTSDIYHAENLIPKTITLSTSAQTYITAGGTNYTLQMPNTDPYTSARTPSAHDHERIKPTRHDSDDPAPNTKGAYLTFQFSYIGGNWWNVLNMRSYTDMKYVSAELLTPANNPGADTGYSGNMMWRQGRNSTWLDMRTILDSANYTDYTVKKDGTGATGTWDIDISGNAATATTATNSDKVDEHHAMSAGSLLYKYAVTATIPASSVSGDFWYATITFARSYVRELTRSMLDATYSNRQGQVYLNTYEYNGAWYAFTTNYNGSNIKGIAYKSQNNPIYYVKLAKPTTYNNAVPDGTITVYSPYNCTITVSATAPSGITFTDLTTPGFTNLKASSASSADSAATATYASNVGTSADHVTAAQVKALHTWYTAVAGNNASGVIDNWNEIKNFIDGFHETDDLATYLTNTFLAKSGGTMTGPIKWTDSTALPEQTSPQYFVCIDAFNSGGTTKWASKANTLKALTGLTSTAIGDSDEPVYWDGGKFVKAGAYPTKASWNYDDVYPKKYSYSLPPQKCVKITYSNSAPVIISACRSNGQAQFLLAGLGYGADGWIRNQFRCLIPSTCFNWKLSDSACTVELYHNTTNSGNAVVTVITTGDITFTEVNALSGDADTKRFACYDELTWDNIANKPATATGYGYIGTTAVQANSAAQNLTGINDSTFSGVMNITGRQSYAEGIRIHDYSGISSVWFRAVNTDNYDAGMIGITADSTGLRFRLPASATGTSVADKVKIAYGGNVSITNALTVSGAFTASAAVYFTGLGSGSSNVTDDTELLTSYAGTGGFDNTTGAGQVYRRQATKLYNYIKSKTDGLYVTSVGVTDDTTNHENQLRYVKGGSSTYFTVPFATNSDTVDTYHAERLLHGAYNSSVVYDVLEIKQTNTPTEILIKTKLPFSNGNEMPSIYIRGFAYGNSVPVDIHLVFYIYGGAFCNCSATCYGVWKPQIFLFTYVENETTYVGIGLKKSIYYPRLYVDIADIWGNNGSRYHAEWTYEINTSNETTIIPEDNKKELEYKALDTSILGSAGSVAWTNITGKPDTFPVEDIYLKLAGGTMTGAAPINFTHDKIAINFRPDSASYYSKVQYMTAGNEALVFSNVSSVTSFIFKCGYNLVNGSNWNSVFNATTNIPSVQIKKQSLYVNAFINTNVNPDYNFYVGGTAAFTGQITSTVAAGTKPFVITSTTLNNNLNADLLDGFHAADFRNNIVDLRTSPQTFNPTYLKDIVFISEADYTTLVSNGSITKNSITHTYNASNWYVIEDKVPEYAENAGNADYASNAGHAGTAEWANNVDWDNIDNKPSWANSSLAWSDVTGKPTWVTWTETSSNATYSLSNATWTQTITLPTAAGSYILKLVSGNSTLTGVFSIGASDNAKDEISLHLHGNGPRLYARTNGTKLELSRNIATATNTSVTITYRRMI